jgi:hypothetical protein
MIYVLKHQYNAINYNKELKHLCIQLVLVKTAHYNSILRIMFLIAVIQSKNIKIKLNLHLKQCLQLSNIISSDNAFNCFKTYISKIFIY